MPGNLERPDPRPRCKNCRELIVFGVTVNGARSGWFHVESKLMPCYPDNPQATPDLPTTERQL